MKTMHAGLFGIALLGVASPLALTHCSGTDSHTTGSPDGATSSGSAASGATGSGASSSGTATGSGSASGSSAGSGAASGAGSTGPVGEGGSGSDDGGASSSSGSAAVPVPEGGAASDPGMVQCGSAACNTSEKSCCHKTGDAGSDECIGPNGSCAGGTTLRCDEATDCAAGLVCCDTFGSTSCAATCGGGSYQICRSDNECGNKSDAGAAKKCVVQTCGGTTPPGGGTPSPTTTLQACAVESVPFNGGGPGGRPPRVDASVAPPTWGAIPGCTAK